MSEIVRNIVNDELNSLGFKRRGKYWFRTFDEVIHVVGLQKSSWGRQYYVNLAVWVNMVETKDFPKTQECHIQCRLDAVPDSPTELSRSLDEEDSWKMDMETRREILKLALCNAEFVFFGKVRSFESVKCYLENKPNPRCAVTQSLKAII